MHVFIKTLGGQTAIIVVDSSDLVEDLRKKIQTKLDIAPNQQELIFEGRILEDGSKLSHYNISNESTVYLSVRRHIIIKTLTGKEFIVTANPYEFVWQIKEKILEKEGIPSSRQRLIFMGKTLEDDKTLGHYKIQHGSVVHLILSFTESATINFRVPDTETFTVEVLPMEATQRDKIRACKDMEKADVNQMSLARKDPNDIAVKMNCTLDMQSALYFGLKPRPKL